MAADTENQSFASAQVNLQWEVGNRVDTEASGQALQQDGTITAENSTGRLGEAVLCARPSRFGIVTRHLCCMFINSNVKDFFHIDLKTLFKQTVSVNLFLAFFFKQIHSDSRRLGLLKQI